MKSSILKNIILSCSIIISVQSCKTKTYFIKQFNKNEIVIEYFDSGKVKRIYNYKNGLKDGLYCEYNEIGGFILVKGYYKKDKKDGIWIWKVNENSIVKMIGTTSF